DTISYIEAHGTGTSLGDPIEINGLKKAFSELAAEHNQVLTEGYCGIGTVKTNIGHLETAAGIAGVIKTLLAMKHKVLPASLHCKEINPYIDLAGSPFYIVRERQDWVSLKDREGKALPRRAGVSSFGFGGSNAHVIIEEVGEQGITLDTKPYYLITLSGKTAEALRERQVDLLAWLNKREENQADKVALSTISYTLNRGRSHYGYRAAWVMKDVGSLREALTLALEGKQSAQHFVGAVDKQQKLDDDAIYEEVLENIITKLQKADIQNWKQYRKLLRVLANLYAKGYAIDWALLHQGETQQRISLPTYPFTKERYWVPESVLRDQVQTNKTFVQLHPLVHSNTSDLTEQKFESCLQSNTPYLKDYMVRNQSLLPSVVYLEMARAAASFALKGQSIIALEQVKWGQSAVIDKQDYFLITGLYPEASRVGFEIRSKDEDANKNEVIHAQGYIVVDDYGQATKNQTTETVSKIDSRC
ncbi:MAG TPA: ketoacyl-synthetase C-terminal extension domain-containing protein, partial [Candidatus Brocadiales bacterium]|nr:ketoacyl-synthetase C-terminal extension domain-containing protein [Candidatus Brocadiales bacterium]